MKTLQHPEQESKLELQKHLIGPQLGPESAGEN